MANRNTAPTKMLFRNQEGKVVEIPSDQYVPSTKALPDVVFGDDPLSVRFLNDPSKTRAMEIAKARLALTPSLSRMGASNPATSWTDDDFLRLLALQKPLDHPRTQDDVDEEQRLKNKLAASTAEMQLQPMGYKAYPGDAKLTPERIAQMYPPTKDVEAQAAAAKQTSEYREADRELAAERARSIQKALEVAAQKRQENLEGAYSRGNSMLAPENEWLASSAESPQNIMLLPSRPGTQLDPNRSRASQLEDIEVPEELVGPTPGGALVQGASASSKPQVFSPGTSGSLPLMAQDDRTGILGFRGGAYTPGASMDRSSTLNRPFSFSSASAAPKPWSASARTEEERAPAVQPQSRSTVALRPSVSRAPIDFTAGQTSAPTESGSSISNLLGKIFSGNDYQSTGQRVVDDKGVNWGSSESPSDFFRADKARMQRQALSSDNDEGKKRGGAVGGKDAAMHKALEIIHHLLMRQR